MKKVGLLSLAMVFVLALAAMPASADEALFSSLRVADAFEKAAVLDTSFHALVNSPATASLRIVRANPDALTEKTESLRLSLETGVDIRTHRLRSYRTSSGSLVWAGIIEDPGSTIVPFSPDAIQFDAINSVMLVRNGKMITGNVHFAGTWYKIRPLKSGDHAIVVADMKAMPPDHPAEYGQLRTTPMATAPAAGATEAATVIRVMVNYTPAVAAAVADISSLIDLAVAETNQGYLSSGVAIEVVLANKSLTDYRESTFSRDLDRYRSATDRYMKEIHTTRNNTGADVGVLLINSGQYCGLASGIGSTAATAFAAVYWDCATGYYSFAHEIGHLQSARHDPATDGTTTPYAYGHGYRYQGTPSWRTIMAYDCTSGCPRLNFWSNPNNLYNGLPMGTATVSHNARVLNETAAAVAAFRP